MTDALVCRRPILTSSARRVTAGDFPYAMALPVFEATVIDYFDSSAT